MLQSAVNWIVDILLRFPAESKWTEMVRFFIYDSVKILSLLFLMIFAVGILRTYLPHRKVKDWLNRRKGFGYLFASLFGAVTPFCSCSSIPIFFGFLTAGIPLGVAFAFLVTSPLINEYLVVLMLGYFGLKITLLYVLNGILIGVVCGLVLGKLRLERHLVRDFISPEDENGKEKDYRNFWERILFGFGEAKDIVHKIWLWVLIGIGIGALIHNFVPNEAIQAITNKTGIWTVPLAVLIGVPMYGSCAAIVPIAVVLFQKGVSLGTALAFMMATAALSLPEAILLRRAMKLPLIAIFFGITTLAIIVTGYVFNLWQSMLM
ncbi:MAG: hypothetical protein A3G33_10400 [Omnitrophica bacterium RIFCSPLOWO2_12_FULL_44_17]|uniref:Permease n=1 Tax=Candidatus Danuiimicrobium aquiferis TaxID=1801832 RepID=A0A1G1L1T4_9BACT|nr:MAG: hypothetical protein A3B72_01675 [Omnitrophica bacterium RIFCSPHIGHO2_02_FULL_45_28]OGW90464.1 MAG: hypothetical protein A3E74_03610 [Omnitrophica bacterium RIFCSPHIGHO2_12_FULL_44_12]OGW98849.1 MAG: hypothetical protein A3G33_10400 [Omnitrophica bacterium RIFCSPLOWO2_12_FULL_44_17]OGX02810.1 MAG: hypothetical protein A3J12_02520 [Omnitrophica bacterium RIFCSPLOWO2_02_FULL_44_11]